VRVLIDTSYVERGPSGTAVYVRRLVEALRDEGVEVVEAAQRRRLAPGAGNPVRSAVNAALDLAWLHGGLARAAAPPAPTWCTTRCLRTAAGSRRPRW